MAQSVREVSNRLVEAGLQPLEAEVYVHLLVHGAAKAAQVAKAIGKARSETYRTLERMTKSGALVASVGRPVTFSVAPPEGMFRAILFQRQEAVERVRRLGEELVPAMNVLGRGAARVARPDESQRTLEGRDRLLDELARKLGEARQRIDVFLGTQDALHGWRQRGLWERLAERAKTVDTVRALLNPSAGAPKEPWVRAFEGPPGDFVLFDGREALVWLRMGPRSLAPDRERESGLLTDAPGLVRLLGGIFDAAWRSTQ